MNRRYALLSAVALMLLTPAMSLAKDVAISISSLKFKPDAMEISVGDTVIWTNNDDRGHTVISDAGNFASEEIASGQTFSHQFKTAGDFAYHCDHHPRMRGRVIVRAK